MRCQKSIAGVLSPVTINLVKSAAGKRAQNVVRLKRLQTRVANAQNGKRVAQHGICSFRSSGVGLRPVCIPQTYHGGKLALFRQKPPQCVWARMCPHAEEHRKKAVQRVGRRPHCRSSGQCPKRTVNQAVSIYCKQYVLQDIPHFLFPFAGKMRPEYGWRTERLYVF